MGKEKTEFNGEKKNWVACESKNWYHVKKFEFPSQNQFTMNVVNYKYY